MKENIFELVLVELILWMLLYHLMTVEDNKITKMTPSVQFFLKEL